MLGDQDTLITLMEITAKQPYTTFFFCCLFVSRILRGLAMMTIKYLLLQGPLRC